MSDKPILIVEDEVELAQILGDYLKVEGFAAVIANDGECAIRLFEETAPVLVILDIMLPKKDGVEVCRYIRERSDVPVIMLSAKNGDMDKVISLGTGADDYVTKPFSPLELVARVKAHTRRYMNFGTETAESKGIKKVGRLEINSSAYEALVEGKPVEFTTREFEMLCYFAQNINQVLTKEQIYEGIWGMNEYGDISSVAVYVKRIRNKLEKHGLDYIKTVWGAGYKMVIGDPE